MEEYLKNAKKRRLKPLNKINLKPIITKFLLACIFLLISIIYTNTSDKNLLLYKEYVLTESLQFTKIKNIYENLFGEILPKEETNKMVIKGHLAYKDIEDYLSGSALTLNNNTLINSLSSGIVVYIGEKEGYNNTIIVQGVDGIDIWYGNMNNISVKLYDYIKKDDLLGEIKEDKLYLVLKKDNEYIKYEDYQAGL